MEYDLKIEAIEIDLLIEAIYRQYGYDFRSYARASIERRIVYCLEQFEFKRIADMLPSILYEPSFFEKFFEKLTVNTTEMFRDAKFFLSLRNNVFPFLKTFPFFRVWIPGCSTGEEAYSIAILLKEEGLYERAQIYATDYNKDVIRKAKEGVYSLKSIQDSTTNYQKSGGTGSFSDYYIARYGSALIDPSLKSNIVFATHNLTTDEVFNEMQMVSCRNVLIYFNRELQDHVLGLFSKSLCPYGHLCLGDKESLGFSKYEDKFYVKDKKGKIFQKKAF